MIKGAILIMVHICSAKRYCISLLSLFVVLAICLTAGFSLKYPDSAIVSVAQISDSETAVVSQSGNCYIRAHVNDIGSHRLGIKNDRAYKRIFNNPFSIKRMNGFIEIYKNGDAKSVDLTYSGGAIVTQSNEIYVFSSYSEQYYTPVKISASGKAANALDESVFYIDNDNAFCRYYLEDGKTERIAESISDFYLCERTNEIVLLSNSGELSVIQMSQSVLKESEKLLSDVKAFSVFAACKESNFIEAVVGVLRTDGRADIIGEGMLYHSVYDTLIHAQPQTVVTPEEKYDIVDIALYERGYVTLDSSGSAYVTGRDFPFEKAVYSNEKLSDNVTAIASNADAVCLGKNDGTLDLVGHLPDGTDS